MPDVKEKLHEKFHNLKVKATHAKHGLGKFANIVNPNHRHDEAHEKETDEKRMKVRESHRFTSFAPERDGNLVKWYIDGRNYFWAVAEALEKAQETIYIADWWLSPELFMKRPPYHNQEWRLDQILKRRAEAGVKIYVQVYKEVEAAITCNSLHTKHALEALCPEGSKGFGNIVVMRHPDHNVLENASDMTFYWAHHEKFIVIDFELAFIGGLDLCFGRWDTHDHPLSDVHPSGVQDEIFPGQDFNNNRIMDFQSVDDWKSNEVSKAQYGRMPWHDVAMGLIGPAVYDIAAHFVLRWNFCKRDKYKRDEEYDWLVLEGHDSKDGDDESLIGIQRPKYPVGEYLRHPFQPIATKQLDNRGTVHAQLVRSSADWSAGLHPPEDSIQEAYIETIRNAQHFVYIENQFFITATGDQQNPVHNTIGRAIVEACVRAGKEGRRFRVIIIIPCIPGFAGDLRLDAATGTRAIMDYQYKSIHRGEHSICGQIEKEGVDPKNHIFVFNLRSYDRLNNTPALKAQEEQSGVNYRDVQRAQAEEIMQSGVHGGDLTKEESRDKAQQEASAQKDQFEAKREQVGLDEKGTVKSADTIAKDAMLGEKKVSQEAWDPVPGEDAEQEKERFVQEQLYIHGKLLIVDDRTVICGSSNINDRSQLGYHDSELAIVLTDKRTIPSTMNGQPYEASYLATTMRRMLWREHLGLLPSQPINAESDINALPPSINPENDNYENTREYEFVADPLGDEVWDLWCHQATVNTEVFRDLFHADPDDSIRTFDDYAAYLPEFEDVKLSSKGQPSPDSEKDATKHEDKATKKAEKEEVGKDGKKKYKQGHLWATDMPVSEVKKQLDRIRGHLVWMPLRFLEDAEMAEKGMQVNSFTESVYT